MEPLKLRDYQVECLRAVRESYLRGIRRQLVSLPTGTGKTVVFAQMPSYFKMKKRMLVLAHRHELLDQAREKFLGANPDLSVGIEQAGQRASESDQVVIASVQTLERGGKRARLLKLSPEDFSVVVVDEAHHAVARSYVRILEHLGLMEEDTEKLLVGVTATPRRGDGRGLDAVFQDITFSRDIKDMIEAGYLSNLSGYRISSSLSLDGVKARRDDFVDRELARAVNLRIRNEKIVQSYSSLASPRRTLVFCVDVKHAKDVASLFLERGVEARAVWGDMPAEERAAVLEEFREGAVRVVTNCNVLTEGFDEPRIECVIMGRPTKSSLLYTQMIGRGTRTHPGKKRLIVIDIVDNTRKHRLQSLPVLFGLGGPINLKGNDVLKGLKFIESVKKKYPFVDVSSAVTLEDIRRMTRKVDLIGWDVSTELDPLSPFAWFRMPDGSCRISLAEGESMTVEGNILGYYEVFLSTREGPAGRYVRKRLFLERGLKEAVRKGDRYIRSFRKESIPLIKKDLSWRKEKITAKQKELLLRNGLKVSDKMTRGEASRLIAGIIFSKKP